MTTAVFTVSVSGTGKRATLTGYDGVYVPKNIVVASTDNSAVTGTGSYLNVTVAGVLVAAYDGINLGTIGVDRHASVAVRADGEIYSYSSYAININSSGSDVTNAGFIHAWDVGVRFASKSTTTSSTLINTGVIESDNDGVRHGSSATETLIVKNSGTITGAVYSFSDIASAAVDKIINTGTMNGTISLGNGDDTYDGHAGHVKGTVLGGAGADTILTGSDKDILDGGADADTLNGGSGADTLIGGTGKDKLTGGADKDHFVFNTAAAADNVDTITDFKPNYDKMQLSKALFAALGGSVTESEFWSNNTGKAHDGSDNLIYEKDTGKLFYDADGDSATLPVQIAVLAKNLALTFHDFDMTA